MPAAARIDGWGGPPLIDEVRDPEAGEGESFVQVTAAAGAQIALTVGSGTFAFRPELTCELPRALERLHAGQVSGRLAVVMASHDEGSTR